jgi:hypothetical protein
MFAKISKKVVAVALVAAMAITTATVANEETASAATKKAKVVQGKEVKLTASASATWKSSNDNVAHCQKTSGKSIKVLGIKKGTATITATAGGKKQTWKVSVSKAKKGTVIYNFAKSTDPDNHPPYKADYSEFKYNSFRIWLCSATFYGEGTYISPDYRGRKLSITLKVKNSGKRTLPEMGVCFNYTKGGDTGAYPWALHVSAKKLSSKVTKDKTHKHCKIVKKAMKKGKSYTFKFTFTIPTDAVNGDTDSETGANYPIMMYIPNMKDTSPYKAGDSITVQSCVIKIAN